MAPHLLDLHFQGTPGVIAAYAVPLHSGGVALIDPGPSSTLTTLERGLGTLSFTLEDVRAVLLTHIHLDHAGVAGTLAERGADVYVHERGAAHLARPDRLLASARTIYAEHMDALWGDMRPVPRERLHAVQDGSTVTLGSDAFHATYAPGHAVHHVAWQHGDDLFVGDVAGVRLDARQTPRAPTPPPDIDLDAWAASVARLRALPARTLHLTHYGSYPATDAHWDNLLRTMHADAARVREGLERQLGADALTAEFTRAVEADLAQEGDDLAARFRYACPAWMSVQGLTRYWTRKANA
ncbi:MBL fold metallo-hydrolase [Deinococcus maricopensis]|uniref:Beta-lactamase domain protein n=1 Tax=Deinococcus maricopensis (strain DSM 21211 / LMG 22137 / NRRL B-23946 / LB-34) TaxID=709986 RepID=E8U9F3_DEIML|nr:beta-lactamase domain protein [Deinococcus maricopensis DSM 21211]